VQFPPAHLADPARFAEKLSRGTFIRYPHIRFLSNRIADAYSRRGVRLLVSMPFQCGKSLLFAQWMAAWMLELDPTRRILVVSYSASLAARSVRANRDLFASEENGLRTKLGKRTEDLFETTAGGYCMAAGITGTINGWGYTDIIIDDLYMNADEAFSASHRQKVKEAFYAVLVGRLAKRGNIWGINTRWHDDDLFGEFIRGGGWDSIVLPAFAREDDPMGRAPGEVLCEDLHPAAEWISWRDGPNGDGQNAMLPAIWAAAYDAKPLREGSGLFNRSWVQTIDVPPALHSARVRYWDLAASKTRPGRLKSMDRDYAVGTLGMRTREERYVVEHVERLRGTAQDVDDAIIRCATMDGRGVPIVVEKEPGSNGEMYASYLTRRLAGWSVTFKPSTGAKETRFRPFAAQCQAGNVSIVRAAWNGPWFDELEVAFAGGAHDDQADSSSGAFAELCQGTRWPWLTPGSRGIVSGAEPRDAPPPRDRDEPELVGADPRVSLPRRSLSRRYPGFGDELTRGGIGE
jgi:predicted phage terminase large subunit-like protein